MLQTYKDNIWTNVTIFHQQVNDNLMTLLDRSEKNTWNKKNKKCLKWTSEDEGIIFSIVQHKKPDQNRLSVIGIADKLFDQIFYKANIKS